MAQDAVIGIIGGQGWMGRSLGMALLGSGEWRAERLLISSRTGQGEAFRDWPEVRCLNDNQALVDRADVVVLSVRPQDLDAIEVDAHGKLVISLLAMTSLEAIAERMGSRRVVRAMPNAAAELRRAYFPWYAASEVDDDDRWLVQTLLASCGTAREVPEERDLDYLTALSGAGPAYPALLAQALLTHARQAGIDDEIAREAVLETLVGGALLLEREGVDPGEMVERLIAYEGTTAKGLRSMIDGGLEQVVHRGLNEAYRAARGG
ncbi:pyrroline-5-carboxylate reductase family protein [Larsenimonas salina]|uniref:pyrroline-5-carboxylate reductase family protein n=1 Tax=Larsenimonas salina TaxID=1295565 RepID=UPI0020733265|nr:pyrroline-5-carboxylate reductase dimerization domain-containing protein [Larsenimonas salina]MCM5705780.1 NAD(P)-binding domain-containing protein [Larsenimonas salina]